MSGKVLNTLILFFLIVACDFSQNHPISKATTVAGEDIESRNAFNDYWYAGKAEVNSYQLQQVQYGEIHDGDIVLVFVTEPFSESEQVKLDYPQEVGRDKVDILKLNSIRKFNTGIYDYSMMTSIFTPVDHNTYPYSLKSTTSSQEWCGHSFTQLNLDGNKYRMQQFSYFEQEGDVDKNVDAAILEDALFNHLRLNGGELPLGDIDLIPSTIYTRLKHEKIRPTAATIRRTQSESKNTYIVEYQHYNRTLTIDVEQNFPHKILAWSEDNGEGLKTTARLKETLNTDYWSKHNNQHEGLRDELRLTK
ncbi:MAG: hypothetical protein AAGG68_09240 [Bacteroidota bacterium]